MSAILRALNKRNVELSSEKVELSNINEMKSADKSVADNVDKLADLQLKADKAISNFNAQVKLAEDEIKKAKALSKDFASKAKDLGFKPDSIAEYKKLSGTIDFFSKILTTAGKRFK